MRELFREWIWFILCPCFRTSPVAMRDDFMHNLIRYNKLNIGGDTTLRLLKPNCNFTEVTLSLFFQPALLKKNLDRLEGFCGNTKFVKIHVEGLRVTQYSLRRLRELVQDDNITFSGYKDENMEDLMQDGIRDIISNYQNSTFSKKQFSKLIFSDTPNLVLDDIHIGKGARIFRKALELLSLSNLSEVDIADMNYFYAQKPGGIEENFLLVEQIICNPAHRSKIFRFFVVITHAAWGLLEKQNIFAIRLEDQAFLRTFIRELQPLGGLPLEKSDRAIKFI